jgi:cold shock CspA family protein/cytidylate kinase
MPKVIAIYGQACSLKSDIAREVSRLTGYKVKHPGEAITTKAKTLGKTSGLQVEEDYHRSVDRGTIDWIRSHSDPIIIAESTQLGFVLGAVGDLFRVEVQSKNEARESRWVKRKEEGGGRTRQIGESLSARDQDDKELQTKLYGSTDLDKQPDLVIDSTSSSAEECALKIWAAFEGKPIDESYLAAISGKPAMDKKQTKGIRPGPSSGVVRVYSVNRNPFGGYIDDEISGKAVYVHKSAVEGSGLAGLEKGQRFRYVIEEDGVGGFRAVDLEPLNK